MRQLTFIRSALDWPTAPSASCRGQPLSGSGLARTPIVITYLAESRNACHAYRASFDFSISNFCGFSLDSPSLVTSQSHTIPPLLRKRIRPTKPNGAAGTCVDDNAAYVTRNCRVSRGVNFAVASAELGAKFRLWSLSRPVAEVEDLYEPSLFVKFVIHEDRAVYQFPHAGSLSDNGAHARKASKQFDVILSPLPKRDAAAASSSAARPKISARSFSDLCV